MISKKQQDYVNSLMQFLLDSSEIGIVDNLIEQLKKRRPNYWNAIISKRKVNILDIGSGDGSKSIYLASILAREGVKATVDAIEPIAKHRKRLIKSHSKAKNRFLGRMWSKPLAEVKSRKKYDLVLLLHSAYQFPKGKDNFLLTFEKFFGFIAPKGMAVIVAGHPSSDLHKLKAKFISGFGKGIPVSSQTVAKTLRKNNIPFETAKIVESNVMLGEIKRTPDEKLGERFAFLFYNSLNDSPLNSEQYSAIGKWARNHSKNKKSPHLVARDALFWVWGSNAKNCLPHRNK